jgi:hypothetical protein
MVLKAAEVVLECREYDSPRGVLNGSLRTPFRPFDQGNSINAWVLLVEIKR